MMEMVGEGVHGSVYRALDQTTGNIVAVKRLHIDDDDEGIPSSVIREVSCLHELDHPHIVQLLDKVAGDRNDFTLVFEYVGDNLYSHLRSYRRQGQRLPFVLVKSFASQMLDALFACHVRCIMHRDLKSQNILISGGILKICDFRLSRTSSTPGNNKQYTSDVVTVWYRAPELLLGAPYSVEVDIWSAGCVFAEMLVSVPIFASKSEIGTLFKIFMLMGTPTEETWEGVSQLTHWKDHFPRWRPSQLKPIRDHRPELSEMGIQLLNGMLSMSPVERFTARKAKNHQFFASQ
eukprot:TRINITY_DN4406_c0_g3_i2.p1 TRINITY_DN4406_c0_g3~~TRINITY_DN4406_c0_g3_i2.p1  ORF type:complete len:332 (-),score=35.87 TRINITY_DN4406_c0_g3_i2:16-888(-)